MFQYIDADDVQCETYMRDKARVLGCKIEMDGLNDWFYTRSVQDFLLYKAIISDLGTLYGKTTAIFNKELDMMRDRLMWANSTVDTNNKQHELELENKDMELKNERYGRQSDKREYKLMLQLELERNEKKDVQLDNYKLKIEILELKRDK